MNYAQKIIQRCGGVRALARLMNRPTSTVGSWGDRGSIPDDEKACILSLSNEHAFGLGPEDFFPSELLPSAGSGACPDEKDAA
jgi:hypothetical protein